MVNTSESLDIKKIIEILPHRYPFLLVDRVLEMDLEKGFILAQKKCHNQRIILSGTFS